MLKSARAGDVRWVCSRSLNHHETSARCRRLVAVCAAASQVYARGIATTGGERRYRITVLAGWRLELLPFGKPLRPRFERFGLFL
jgi:hypothetical protein